LDAAPVVICSVARQAVLLGSSGEEPLTFLAR
jgi:hypothetical protein